MLRAIIERTDADVDEIARRIEEVDTVAIHPNGGVETPGQTWDFLAVLAAPLLPARRR